ncbi:YciC family protein [Marinobacterium sp. YM272]|uniref:YciC family protein n=1 Tax=Marinobacterium sp. YM272 TaxID=3421654 RepID=UPI003D7FE7CF
MAFDYLRQTLFFFRQHLLTLAAIQLPFLLLLALLNYALIGNLVDTGDPEIQMNAALASLARLVFLPFYLGGTIIYLQSVIDNQPVHPLTAILSAAGSWGRLLLTYILNAIAISVGFMLLIVPGVYVGVRFAVADYACVLERKGPIEALRGSWNGTSEHFWLLLQGLALLMGLLFLTNVLISQAFGAQPLLSTLFSVIIDFLGVLVTIYGFRIYCVIREEQRNGEI